jgi:hypothetical protein
LALTAKRCHSKTLLAVEYDAPPDRIPATDYAFAFSLLKALRANSIPSFAARRSDATSEGVSILEVEEVPGFGCGN